ncbi:helix-turn-helix transcriptional regulator [Vibrio cholerae]|uniref:helix-turn-helix transcriptional regulator n=1 Tax=Vibrio cholerae TaxID=666 RepID=UPI0006E5B286|nr:AraC family transcriptional regulator [Vibrio cholerae]EGQ9890373.1 helix-turn-helix transcriptional regulator [Vibrio cholerae]EGR1070401.1 AraC family transcriptional regulator [Vibrio cholerae]EGR1858402.1 AraC family transcriptional regulator [Vibrio cholerae]EJL6835849.1 helix-turn-helix transcriptional regulator [Vibrio cholerae]EJO4002353.1 helix-turn-helix transcriptional regulator [Vibrio cholerae]
MNSVELKPKSIRLTSHCSSHQSNLLAVHQPVVCQSFGGCLGCHIHTLSGYGRCASSQIHANVDQFCLRLLTVIQGDQLTWYSQECDPMNLHQGKSVLIFSANVFDDVFISETGSYVEIADIRFECQFLASIYQQMGDSLRANGINPLTEKRRFVFDTRVEMQKFISQLQVGLSKQCGTENLYAVSQAYQCLAKLLSKLDSIQCDKKCLDSSSISNRTLNRIRQAHAMMASEPEKNWSIGELCRQVGTNETSFKRGFKLLFNTTFSKLLQHTRMKIAAEVLRHSDQPIIDIAYQVGYTSPSHFSKLFKQHFGVNPLQYRKNGQAT